MNVLLTGSTGQLGRAIIQSYEKSLKNSGINLITPTRLELDLSNLKSVENSLEIYKPDWIINTAAYTAVDKAEDERNIARDINAFAPIKMGEILKKNNGKFLQISTDYVFSGSQNSPYKINQKLDPINYYGETKAESEKGLQEILGKKSFILRTSWVYSNTGKNFVLSILKLHKILADKNDPLRVVVDQIGVPTNVKGLASCCWNILLKKEDHLNNIYHWSDAGVSSWYDFAIAIGEISASLNLIKKKAKVIPIKSVDFSCRARRPAYSILDTFTTTAALQMESIHWRKQLSKMLTEKKNLNLI